jgi:arginase
VHETVAGVRAGVAGLLASGDPLLLLGGCCIPLMGALAGARDVHSGVGLVYLDGHLDLYDHRTSPTGEAADMPTAAVLGIGEPGLLSVMDAPVVTPDRVALLGARDRDEWPAVGHLVDELSLAVVEPAAITDDPRAVTRGAVERAGSGGAFWLHLDVDVFDEVAFPATDYLMPSGLGVETGRELLAAIGGDDRLVGVSVGCYNPEKDPDRRHGGVLIELLAAAVGRP